MRVFGVWLLFVGVWVGPALASGDAAYCPAELKQTLDNTDGKRRFLAQQMAHELGDALALAKRQHGHLLRGSEAFDAEQLEKSRQLLKQCATTLRDNKGLCGLNIAEKAMVAHGIVTLGGLATAGVLQAVMEGHTAALIHAPVFYMLCAGITNFHHENLNRNFWDELFDTLRKDYNLPVPRERKAAQAWFKTVTKTLVPLNPGEKFDMKALRSAVHALKNQLADLQLEATQRNLPHYAKVFENYAQSVDKIPLEGFRTWGPLGLQHAQGAIRTLSEIEMQAAEVAREAGVSSFELWQTFSRSIAQAPAPVSFRWKESGYASKVRKAFEREGEWDHLLQYLGAFEEKFGTFKLNMYYLNERSPDRYSKTGYGKLIVSLTPDKYEAHHLSIPFATTLNYEKLGRDADQKILKGDAKAWTPAVSNAIQQALEDLEDLQLKPRKYTRYLSGGRNRDYGMCSALLRQTLERGGRTPLNAVPGESTGEDAGFILNTKVPERVPLQR